MKHAAARARLLQWPLVAFTILLAAIVPSARQAPAEARAGFDEALDLYVRDGWVYYRQLKAQRAGLDRYIAALATATVASATRADQIALWLNAYNAIVLQTIIDHYPIVPHSRDYPSRSVRQIPGAFERLTHRVAGQTVTLDQIEQTILSSFHDPRVYFALGRGAVGSGRLRSEAYTGAQLEHQLADDANECLTHAQCVSVDAADNVLKVSSIFSWREADFDVAYGDKAPPTFGTRSVVERAALAFVQPKLLTTEREFLEKNTFKVEFIPFDWSLNDLTGR